MIVKNIIISHLIWNNWRKLKKIMIDYYEHDDSASKLRPVYFSYTDLLNKEV